MAHSRTIQKQSQKAFSILFENSYDAVALHSIGDKGRLIDVNETFCRLLHYKRSELLQLQFVDLIATEYKDAVVETFESISRDGVGVHEICLLSRNSERIMMEFNSHFLDYLGEPAILSIGRDISLIRRAAKNEERYRVFLSQSTEAIWRVDLSEPVPLHLSEEEQIDRFYRHGFLAECNDTMAHQYGLQSAEEFVGAKLVDLLPRSDEHNLDFLRAFIRSGYRLSDAETHEVDSQGKPKFFLNNLIGYVKDGLLYHAWGTQRDVTERKQTIEHLKASEERHRLLFERNLAGVYRTNMDGKILDCNDSFARILGYDSRRELMSMVSWELYCEPEDREKFLSELMKSHALTNFEIRLRKRDGSVLWALENVTYLPATTSEESIIEGTLIDITDRKKAEEQIAFQAYHDPLTGLPNRNLFRDRLSQALANALRHEQGLAILFLDLDRFKLINDTLGHSVGDWVLKQVADRLRGCVRGSDTVARLGGDEFILYLSEIIQSESAARVAQKILEIIAEPFFLDEQELYVTTSIGISVFPADGQDVDALIKSADSAMYLAKDSGRNNYQLSSPALNVLAHQRLLLERNLRQAVERKEFVLYYQPQFHLQTGGVSGLEALIRWNHPEKGIVAPEEFIPLAEESRLIFPIGEWALWEACRQLRVWHLEGFTHLSVSANLSAKQFQHQTLADHVEHLLFETGLNPSSLILEITETVAMQNVERTVRILRKLRNIGVRIALDDFGTGYSSLSYLKYFPIDIIKIDPSFVRNVGMSLHEEALVRAVIHLGHSLKRKVVAEGVETEMQRVFLKYEGCEEVQGFLFSPPIPAEEIPALIKRHRI